jgi:hypothetical protein
MTTTPFRLDLSRTRCVLLAATIACGAAACASEAPPQAKAAGAGAVASKELNEATAKIFENVETHADVPPHGGQVIELGHHAAHAELLLVPDTGEVTVHVLDRDGQPGKRIAQPSLLLDIVTSGREIRLELKAAPEEGESIGDASRFTAVSEELLRVGSAKFTLRWILVDGQVFSDTVIDWGTDAPTS